MRFTGATHKRGLDNALTALAYRLTRCALRQRNRAMAWG